MTQGYCHNHIDFFALCFFFALGGVIVQGIFLQGRMSVFACHYLLLSFKGRSCWSKATCTWLQTNMALTGIKPTNLGSRVRGLTTMPRFPSTDWYGTYMSLYLEWYELNRDGFMNKISLWHFRKDDWQNIRRSYSQEAFLSCWRSSRVRWPRTWSKRSVIIWTSPTPLVRNEYTLYYVVEKGEVYDFTLSARTTLLVSVWSWIFETYRFCYLHARSWGNPKTPAKSRFSFI